MNTNYNKIFKFLITPLSIILISYIISFIVFTVLPKKAPVFVDDNQNNLQYKRYEIQAAFKNTKVKEINKEVYKPKKQEYKFLSNISLQAIYDMGENAGFIIVIEKGKAATTILSLNDDFKGYKLSQIYPKYVVFTKSLKEYKLLLNAGKDVKYDVEEKVIPLKNNVINKNVQKNNNDGYNIKREYLDSYLNDYDKIWKEIRINEIKTQNGIDGFKISYIKDKSVFYDLGLKSGDIIKSVNNIKLKSYNDAFKMYKQINKIKNLNIEIIRNNEPMEINYEIK